MLEPYDGMMADRRFAITEDLLLKNSRSSKEPIKMKPNNSRKRQAEKEYNLIKGLAQCIAEKKEAKVRQTNKKSC